MKVLVTGATGFTGSHVVPLLLERGHDLRCLVRESSNRSGMAAPEVEWVVGDLGDFRSLCTALAGVDALVNVASLGLGHAPNIIDALQAASVDRAVFVSTTAVFTKLNAQSKAVRLAAEDTIRQCLVAYTILRPTMIYGSSRDRNICRLIRYIRRWPVLPVAGSGEYLQQPVYVGDVAWAIARALTSAVTVGRSYNIPGGTVLSYNQVVDTVSALQGRRVAKLHIPRRPAVGGLSLLERLIRRLPIRSEQLLRLNEHKVFDYSAAAKDFGYAPRSFEAGIRLELKDMFGDD